MQVEARASATMPPGGEALNVSCHPIQHLVSLTGAYADNEVKELPNRNPIQTNLDNNLLQQREFYDAADPSTVKGPHPHASASCFLLNVWRSLVLTCTCGTQPAFVDGPGRLPVGRPGPQSEALTGIDRIETLPVYFQESL
jgi:hypothetical protein